MGRRPYSYRQTVEECKSISTIYLNQNNLFNRGIHNTTFSWTIWKTKTGSIGLQVSTIEGDEHVRLQYTLTDRFSGQEKYLDYRVKLVSTPCYYGGHRWWFTCPLVANGNMCGRRVGVLYLSDGECFGCRHCYNLTYKCQKESHKFDELDKHIASLLKNRKKH